jgi:hypothetical protein
MAVSKKFSLGVIFASATLTIMAGSIIAPVLNLMRDGLGVAPSSVGLIITTHGEWGNGDVLKKVNNLKTNRYRKKETSMNDRGAFLCDAAESSFLI